MGENDQPEERSEEVFTGRDILYRERGVTGLDVQRAADALLRLGIKPSIAAVREQLGGGSPNTVAPLLEQYWRSLGQRLPEGPKALEGIPESLARLCEALWLRSLAEARERAKLLARPDSAPAGALAQLEQKVAELSAALSEARAQISAREAELLTALQDRVSQAEQIRSLTALLAAEQQLRAEAQRQSDRNARELADRRAEVKQLATRRLARYMQRTRAQAKNKQRRSEPAKPRGKRVIARRAVKSRARLKARGHR